MKYAPELGIKIELNHGATGTAFMSGNPCIVVKQADTWSGQNLPGSELEKIHPDLKWVISLPVKSERRGIIVGVVNVDGLDIVPDIIQNTLSEGCAALLVALHYGMLKRFEPCLDAAFRGDKLPRIEA
jgi:hypothetical protein